MTRENKKPESGSADVSARSDARAESRPDHSITMGSMGCEAEYSSDNDELIGEALKSVYRQTIDEALPSEFQDLLDKLA
ncbi:MAG: NepR family anti-sigma factor [Pseudomonadota bacterium]